MAPKFFLILRRSRGEASKDARALGANSVRLLNCVAPIKNRSRELGNLTHPDDSDLKRGSNH